MSFRLDSLSYIALERLTELAHPSEIHRLQLAAPTLKPINKKRNKETFISGGWLIGDEGGKIDFRSSSEDNLVYTDNELLICCDDLDLDGLFDTHLNDPIFNNLFLQPNMLSSADTLLTPAMLQMLASHDMTNVKKMYIVYTEEINYDNVFTVFPSLQYLCIFGDSSLLWIKEMRLNQKIETIELTASGQSLPMCAVEDIVNLFKGQETGFTLIIMIVDPFNCAQIGSDAKGFLQIQKHFDNLLKSHFHEEECYTISKKLVVNYFHYFEMLTYVLNDEVDIF